MGGADKPVVWLAGEIRTPPFPKEARLEAGFLLRRLQRGETLGLPHVRPMPQLGRRAYELRVLMVRLDADAVMIAGVSRGDHEVRALYQADRYERGSVGTPAILAVTVDGRAQRTPYFVLDDATVTSACPHHGAFPFARPNATHQPPARQTANLRMQI